MVIFPAGSTDTTPAAQPPGNSPAEEQAHKKNRAVPLHGEGVVKKGDGGFETRLTQQGTIEAVGSASITVKSEDGFSQTYAINAGTPPTDVAALERNGVKVVIIPGSGHFPMMEKPGDFNRALRSALDELSRSKR